MLVIARRLGAASLLLGVASCSFLTDFPAIEGAGGALGTGGSTSTTTGGGSGNTTTTTTSTGTTGGGGAACLTECEDAFGGAEPPPELAGSFSVHGEPSALAANFEITDGVQTIPAEGSSGGGGAGGGAGQPETWWIATYKPSGEQMVEPNVPETLGQHGLLLGPGGEVLRKLVLCTSANMVSTQEVFLNGMTALNNGKVVVVGGLEDNHIANTVWDGACGSLRTQWDSNDDTASSAGESTPFVSWFRPDGTLALTATSNVPASGTSYFSDVAAGVTQNDEVFAVGVGNGNPYGLPLGTGRARYFLSRIENSGSTYYAAALDRYICADDQTGELHGLRSSIAVDANGAVWVGGTGCAPAQQLPASRSFLYRYAPFEGASPGAPQTHVFDKGIGNLSITRIAVTADLVLVAGSYDGTPIPQSAQGAIEAGDGDDGFLMAFTRSGEWGSERTPAWFLRLEASGPVRVKTLTAEGGRIFVGGSVTGDGNFGGASWCFDEGADRERAFFAAFDEDTAQLGWLRLFGSPPSGGDTGAPFVRGTAAVPEVGGLAIAYTTQGASLVECADSGATQTSIRAEAATLSF